jgi:RNA polymerase sigma factor (sigma-70 family)
MLTLSATDRARFEREVLSYLDAGYNLARWLVRSEADAEDVVQEAVVRAFRFFEGYRGGDARAWLLTIVRNTCYSWLQKNRPGEVVALEDRTPVNETTPESIAMQLANRQLLVRALEKLPTRQREIIVLRDLEGCSYKEIATVMGVPIGTVMSTLSRARHELRAMLVRADRDEVRRAM